MKAQSLGIESDLIFHRRNGEVLDRGGYLLVRTPTQPTYFWGNYLILPEPPTPVDLADLEITFRRELANQPLSSHCSFTWDSRGMSEPLAASSVQAFQERGYEYDVSVVLMASRVRRPAHPNFELEYRVLSSDDNWDQMLELQLKSRGEDFAEVPYRAFLRERVAAWRRLIAEGCGVWLGAFELDTLVADAGLFWAGSLGRFQNVETRESHRRRGICGTLVHRLCEYGFEKIGLTRLVMQADEEYHAARIYESLGFERLERLGSLCRYDRDQWGSKP